MPGNPAVMAYLDEVAGELDAVRRLVQTPPNRTAAFHLQQAAEKLVKAVRLHRGIPATIDHNIEVLIASLPEGEPWRVKLSPFEWLSAFATAYRYPSPKGKRNPGPAADRLLADAGAIELLLQEARSEFKDG